MIPELAAPPENNRHIDLDPKGPRTQTATREKEKNPPPNKCTSQNPEANRKQM
jgi:hypothetical protein